MRPEDVAILGARTYVHVRVGVLCGSEGASETVHYELKEITPPKHSVSTVKANIFDFYYMYHVEDGYY